MPYQLNPWQAFAINCTAPILVVVAGRETGKTTTAEFIKSQSRRADYSPLDVLVFAPSYAMTNERPDLYTPLPSRGYRPRADVIVADEAGYFTTQDIAQFLAMLRPGGRLVLLGTPHPTDVAGNALASWWTSPRQDVQKLAVPTATVGIIPAEDLAYRRTQISAAHYEQQYGCQFPKERRL